jgi:hypothetical protein
MHLGTALLPAELLPPQTLRHTVGVVEASDVRGDECRMHPSQPKGCRLDGVAGQLPVARDRPSLLDKRRAAELAETIRRIDPCNHRDRLGRGGVAGRPGHHGDHAGAQDDGDGSHNLQGAEACAAVRLRPDCERCRPLERCGAQRGGNLFGPVGECTAGQTTTQVRVEQCRLELGELAVGAQRRPGPGAFTRVRFLLHHPYRRCLRRTVRDER